MIIDGKRVEASVISLWKASDRGISFAKVRDALKAEGIVARKVAAKSGFEGRFDVKVPADLEEKARVVLFLSVNGFEVQRGPKSPI